MDFRRVGLGLLDAIVKVFFLVIIIMFISKYAKVAYNYGYHIFNQVPVSSGTGRTVTVVISGSESASDIADKLASVGLITDKLLFRLQEQFSDYHGMEAAGTYELSTSMTPEEMLQIMASGANGDTTETENTTSGEDASTAEVSSEEVTEEVSGD